MVDISNGHYSILIADDEPMAIGTLVRVLGDYRILTANNGADAVKMAKVGADVLVAHMGLTTKGSVGAHTSKTLDDCVREIQQIHDAAKEVNPDIIVLCHGGPISEAEDADYVIRNTNGVSGFTGASSIERLPTEIAIYEQVKKFKRIRID